MKADSELAFREHDNKGNKSHRFIKFCCIFLFFAFVVTLSLTIYYAFFEQRNRIQPVETVNQLGPTRLNLQKAVNHYVSGLNNSSAPFTYMVFTDPQLGLYDVVKGRRSLFMLFYFLC